MELWRYEFCLHALIVLALVHFFASIRTPPLLVRALAIVALGLLHCPGLPFEVGTSGILLGAMVA